LMRCMPSRPCIAVPSLCESSDVDVDCIYAIHPDFVYRSRAHAALAVKRGDVRNVKEGDLCVNCDRCVADKFRDWPGICQRLPSANAVLGLSHETSPIASLLAGPAS
jgi:hypothetical protein